MLDSILSKEDLKRLSSAWNITSGTDLYHDIARQIEAAVLQHIKLREQMEVYAAAKVREALKEAAWIVDLATQSHHVECWDNLESLATRIRALIPSTPA